jgi:hypothetical protein
MDGGYAPRTSFDWQAASSPQNLNVNREEAQALVCYMQEIWDKAKVGIKHAQ